MTIKPSRPAIGATGLRKSFGDQVVLDGLDLNVPPGTVYALLGANGAGKTTTVKILPANPTRCAPRSASPASSPRWTTCSPGRRTCC
jgi:ABC-type transporter Mla maintaining outer membrane lipid asymmetry ATPase subunit MlaF